LDYSFPRYLLSKDSVDERALNRHVYSALVASRPADPLLIIEVGAGIGTMLTRLLRWGFLQEAEYVAVDEMAENIKYARDWIPRWAADNKLRVETLVRNGLRLFDDRRDVHLTLQQADVFDYGERDSPKSDLLIAHAVLDLLRLPESLPKLFSLIKPGGLAWLTINFDGVTTFEPAIDPALDAKIEALYHLSMEERPTGGDSRTGRHLFDHLQTAGATILAAGASDWVVHATDGKYPADEAYFLNFILHFFESSLGGHAGLETSEFNAWLAERRAQVERGELVYIAHQMDFLARV
jgi:SAM-dependent methyltransferase